jgi:hypothetical protein
MSASIVLAILLGAVKSPSVWLPTTRAMTGAACAGSPVAVGTGNVPLASDRATTVVNIWALFKNTPDANTAFAWIYKNVSGQFWLQIDAGHQTLIRSYFPQSLAKRVLQGSGSTSRSIPTLMPALAAYDGYFYRMHVTRQACFSADLPANQY